MPSTHLFLLSYFPTFLPITLLTFRLILLTDTPMTTMAAVAAAAELRHLKRQKVLDNRRNEAAVAASSFVSTILASATDEALDVNLTALSNTLIRKRNRGDDCKYQQVLDVVYEAMERIKCATNENELNAALRSISSGRPSNIDTYIIGDDGSIEFPNDEAKDEFDAFDFLTLAGCNEYDSADALLDKLVNFVKNNCLLEDDSWAVDASTDQAPPHNTTFPHLTRPRKAPKRAGGEESDDDEEALESMQYVVGAGRKAMSVCLEFASKTRSLAARDPTLRDLKIAIDRIAARRTAELRHAESVDVEPLNNPVDPPAFKFHLFLVPGNTTAGDVWADEHTNPLATNGEDSYFTVKDGGIVDEEGRSRVLVGSDCDFDVDSTQSYREKYSITADKGIKVVFEGVQFHVNATSANISRKKTDPEFRFVTELRIFGKRSLVNVSPPFVVHSRVK